MRVKNTKVRNEWFLIDWDERKYRTIIVTPGREEWYMSAGTWMDAWSEHFFSEELLDWLPEQ